MFRTRQALEADRKIKKLLVALRTFEVEKADSALELLSECIDEAIKGVSQLRDDIATCTCCKDFFSIDAIEETEAGDRICSECNQPDDTAYPSNAFFGIY